MGYKTVFWDWNGTILDDLQIGIDSINELFLRRKMDCFKNSEDYFNVFCFPIIDYYKKAGFDYFKEPYEDLANEYMVEYYVKAENAPVFDDVVELIKKLHSKGIRQIILSAYKKDGLLELLKHYGLADYFDDVIGLDNIYAKGKIEIAKEWLLSHPFDVTTAVMVGDTVHDDEVAEAIGCDSVFIARGHNSFETLKKLGKPVFEDAKALEEYLFKP